MGQSNEVNEILAVLNPRHFSFEGFDTVTIQHFPRIEMYSLALKVSNPLAYKVPVINYTDEAWAYRDVDPHINADILHSYVKPLPSLLAALGYPVNNMTWDTYGNVIVEGYCVPKA